MKNPYDPELRSVGHNFSEAPVQLWRMFMFIPIYPNQIFLYLKGQTNENLILMDDYIPLGDTRYVIRNLKFVISIYKNTGQSLLAYC